jgi:phage I-like protein
MDLAALLALLGVSTAAEASAAITTFNNMLATLQALSGQTTSQATITFFQNLMRGIGAETGPEALARVAGMQEAMQRIPTLEAELTQFRQGVNDARANELMRLATEEGRLPPASRDKAQAFYKEHGLKSLEAFLGALPQASIKPPPKQPTQRGQRDIEPEQKTPEELTVADLTEDELRVAKATGKSPAQALESKRLWLQSADSTGRVEIPNAHVEDLNKNLIKSRASGASAGR